MLFNNEIGVIDSQDALIGNRAYDLASLVDDVRLKTPMSLKNKIYRLYMGKQKKLHLQKKSHKKRRNHLSFMLSVKT